MIILRFVALAAMAYGAYALLRRNRWTVRERQALILITVATAVIAAGAIAIAMMQGEGQRQLP